MAIWKPGALAADVRGKLGEMIFTRGQGGPTIRSLGTWDQPDTNAQLETRAALGNLAAAWSTVLTEHQRDTWRSYANTNPRPNRWGTPTQTSGYLCFIRHNFHAYLDTDDLAFPAAPTAPPIHPPQLDISINRTTLIASITLPPANYPTPTVDLTLYVYSGIPINAGRSYYSGPWRHLVTITPPDAATSQVIQLPWTWPDHATPPAYTWPGDDSGQTRAYTVAQYATSGAISTRHVITPTMVSP